MKVLLVEDDVSLATQLGHVLRHNDMVAEHVVSAEEALFWPDPEMLGAIVLDLGLPGLDGQAFITRWRAAGHQTPILVLSGRSRWEQKVRCLNAGADDYVVKPVQGEELVARLRSLSRRTASRPIADWLEAGAVRLHPDRKIVEVDGQEVMLSAFEFRLLKALMDRKGGALTQERLMSELYPLDSDYQVNTIDVHITRLRRKIGKDRIVNVRGMGYKIAL